jgi:hypothetical protein
MTPYSSLCDDFGVVCNLFTKMELPTGRETILHFFDSLQKSHPQLTDFETRENGEFVLEEDREQGSYRSVSLENRRLGSGFMNPASVEEADQFHERVLDVAPYHLGFNGMDCDWLDVAFTFDLVYTGNHDEVVAEALGLNTALEPLIQMPGAKVLGYEPSVMMSLDEACRLQCRLSVETRTNAYQLRTGQFPEAPITVYFTVRQYWGRQGAKSFVEGYKHQRKLCQELIDNHVIPAVLRPLNQTISSRQ